MTLLCDEMLERKVLGSCLLKPSLLLELPLTEQHFAGNVHRTIWSQLLWLHAEGQGVDTVRLYERLSSVGKLDAVGGHGYLLELTDTVPDSSPATRRLDELKRLRQLDEQALKLRRACEQGKLEQAEQFAAGLGVFAVEAPEHEPLVTAWDCAELVYDELHGHSKRVVEVYPGLPLMAELVGDLPVGSVTVLGADTNVGKSSIALEMLVGAASADVRGAYVSREDPRLLVGRKFLAMLSGVKPRKIRPGKLEDADWHRLSHAAQVIQSFGSKLVVSQRRGGSDVDTCAAMTRAAQQGAKLVVVDYIQAIRKAAKAQDRRNEIYEVAQTIAAHADRIGVALVLLSQLTIPSGAKATDEPQKHWLKESRDLANMADNIILAHRNEENPFAPIYLRHAKGKEEFGARWTMQRNAKTGRLEEHR